VLPPQLTAFNLPAPENRPDFAIPQHVFLEHIVPPGLVGGEIGVSRDRRLAGTGTFALAGNAASAPACRDGFPDLRPARAVPLMNRTSRNE